MTYSLRLALLSVAACALSAAATYKVSIPVDVTLDGLELKAGDYKIEVNDNSAVIQKGKQKVEAKVHTEAADHKFPTNSIRYAQGNGSQYCLTEISIGGTTTKLIFDSAKPTNGGL